MAERHTISGGGAVEEIPQDPKITEVQGKVEDAAKASESAAESVVDQLLPEPPAMVKSNTATSVSAGERKPVDKP